MAWLSEQTKLKMSKRLVVHSADNRTYKTGDYGFEKNGLFYVQGRKDEQISLMATVLTFRN